MTVSIYSFLGAVLGAVAGLMLQAVAQTLVYPPWRAAHERAKVTASQGLDPSLAMVFVRILGLLVLPVLGFMGGHALLGP